LPLKEPKNLKMINLGFQSLIH